MSSDDYSDTVLLWADMFKDDPFPIVSAAVKSFIATDAKGYPPHIGAVRESMLKITEPKELTEMEAWNMVRKVMSAYATRDEFLTLPPAVRRAVGSTSQLCAWAMTEIDQLPIIMSNFMRSYRAAKEAERNVEKLPASLRKLMEGKQMNLLNTPEEESKEME